MADGTASPVDVVRCEQTDLYTTDCAHCRPRREKVWTAKYETTCWTCRREIEVGDLVQWSQDGTNVECARH